jgi:PAS domain S-box-containing protein
MAINIAILCSEILVLGGIALLLHRLSPRFGLTPLVAFTIGLTVLAQTAINALVVIELWPEFVLVKGDLTTIPIVLLIILILYVSDGTIPARLTIYSCLAVVVLYNLAVLSDKWHLVLPGGSSLLGVLPDSIPFNPWLTLGSLVAFAADLYIIGILYQFCKNKLSFLPDWTILGTTLIVALWIDTVLFEFLYNGLPTRGLFAQIGDDLISRTAAALLLWPLAAVYLTRVAPRLPQYQGVDNRPTFELLFGSLGQIERALTRSEASHRATEAKYTSLFEQANDAVFLMQDEWIIECNPKTPVMFGCERDQIVGKSPVHFSPEAQPDGRPSAVKARELITLACEGSPQRFDWQHIRCDGTPFDAEVSLNRVTFGGKVYLQAMVRDITQRKRAEAEIHALNTELEQRVKERTAELTEANEMLKTLARVRDEFVSNVSHELRTPISNIKLYHQFVEMKPGQWEKYWPTLKRETERLEDLIEGLLMLSRLDQRKTTFTPITLDLNKLVGTVAQDRGLLAQQKNISLELDLQADLPTVYGDAKLLEQALSIFLSNALNYTPPGGQMAVHTLTRSANAKAWVGFGVSDTGPGIPIEEQPNLFERFFRGQAARDTQTPGTGLGLAIAREIANRHRGQIEVFSEGIPGKGATFTIWLPAQG